MTSTGGQIVNQCIREAACNSVADLGIQVSTIESFLWSGNENWAASDGGSHVDFRLEGTYRSAARAAP